MSLPTVILDRILVRKVDPINKIGSILLSDTSQGLNYNEGVILTTGPGAWDGDTLIVCTVGVGDRIGWLKGQGVEVKIDGDDYTIIRESDILFVR